MHITEFFVSSLKERFFIEALNVPFSKKDEYPDRQNAIESYPGDKIPMKKNLRLISDSVPRSIGKKMPEEAHYKNPLAPLALHL